MELSDHKEKCLTELEEYRKYLDSYSANMKELLHNKDYATSKHQEMVPHKKIKMVPGSQGLNGKCNGDGNAHGEDKLLQLLLQQNQRVEKALECITKALDPFLLDQLNSLPVIQEAYDSVLEVYKEDQLLPEAVTDVLMLPHPRVKLDCGMSVAIRINAFCLCRNGDIVVAGEDVVDQIWRIRRFTRLGRLVWNRPLPLSWPSVVGIAEFRHENEDSLLLSNVDEGTIVMIKNKSSSLCYFEKKESPQAMCFSPD